MGTVEVLAKERSKRETPRYQIEVQHEGEHLASIRAIQIGDKKLHWFIEFNDDFTAEKVAQILSQPVQILQRPEEFEDF